MSGVDLIRAKWRDLQIACQILLVLPLAVLLLKLRGFKSAFHIFEWLALTCPGGGHNDTVYIDRASTGIRWFKRHFPLGNCLSRSLTLWFLLHRRNISSVIIIGTRRIKGVFAAHAWVEYQNKPLNAHNKVRQRYAAYDFPFSPANLVTATWKEDR